MKIIVTSDTHGFTNNLRKLIEINGDADMLIHLGDGETDFLEMKEEFVNLNMIMTRGNCDIDEHGILPLFKLIKLNDYITIFACHGHTFNVKNNLLELAHNAQKLGANLALFGHTHVKLKQQKNGLTIINPGSLSLPRDSHASYAKITVDTDKFDVELIDF